MKVFKIVLLTMVAFGLLVAGAFAMKNLPEESGKALFSDTMLGGGTSGKSCNSCHPNGSGLEKAGDKKEFSIMGKKQKGLEEAVNFCIEMSLKGKAIDPMSEQMKDIVAYIKLLQGKASTEKPKIKKKIIMGC